MADTKNLTLTIMGYYSELILLMRNQEITMMTNNTYGCAERERKKNLSERKKIQDGGIHKSKQVNKKKKEVAEDFYN